MDVQYSPEIQKQAEFGLIRKISDQLNEVVGPQSSQIVKADWACVKDHRDRALYRLTLRDFTGEASTDFTLEELRNPIMVSVRLYRLWGDLLQVRNNVHHERVQLLSSQLTTA